MSFPTLFQQSTKTVAQLIQSLGGLVWWDSRYITQRFNGRNELGIDYGLPLSTPISSISSGRVVYAQRMNSNPGSSVGYIVQVENADGSAFHYQHLRSASVNVGDYVRAGQVVGYSGGCPANGYGQGGCTKTDQYSTGPHIEVRYTPHYNGANGAWNQNWVNPQNAFTAYGGAQVSDTLPWWAMGPGGSASQAGVQAGGQATNSLLGISDALYQFPQQMANNLGRVFEAELHPVVDLGIRGLLTISGIAISAVAIFFLAFRSEKQVEGATEKKAVESPVGQAATGAVVGEATGQAAKAIVPPVGDTRRAKLAAAVREHPRPAPPAPRALPAPKPAALPKQKTAPPALAEPDVPRVDDVLKRLRKPNDKSSVQPSTDDLIRNHVGHDATAKVKEVQPPDLPIPKQAEATARQRQVGFIGRKVKREEDERAMRNLRARMGRQARKGSKVSQRGNLTRPLQRTTVFFEKNPVRILDRGPYVPPGFRGLRTKSKQQIDEANRKGKTP